MASDLFTVPLLVGGEEKRSSKTFDIVSPLTGKTAHQCSSALASDAAAAVDAAAGALSSWRRSTPSERRDIFLNAIELVRARRQELVRCLMEETGASASWCDININITLDMIADIAGRISALEGSFPSLKDPDTSGIVLREPYGIVLAVAPWNAPFILGVRAFAFPVAAGNTVVLKASEASPCSIWAMVSVFRDAGLPAGALNMIVLEKTTTASVTELLIANTHVKKINFTGSTAVGRIVGKLAGQYLKPIILELGGKASAIVWEDADLQLAADACARGAFFNSGQICMGTEKMLVHRSIKQPFVEKLKASVEREFPSSVAALTLINSAAVQRNMKLVADATERGASILFENPEPQDAHETKMRPIVLDKVTTEMDIYKTESFGPTVSLIDIESEEEAIRMTNDTEYDLSVAIFTEDLRRGLRFARQIEAGAVHINGMTCHDENALPHGGVKASGYGRFNSRLGLEEWVRTKCVTFRN